MENLYFFISANVKTEMNLLKFSYPCSNLVLIKKSDGTGSRWDNSNDNQNSYNDYNRQSFGNREGGYRGRGRGRGGHDAPQTYYNMYSQPPPAH